MSRHKDKGTRFETAGVRYFKSRGLDARRQALAGTSDSGDVLIEGERIDIAHEFKDRRSMSPKWLGDVVDEAEREAVNAEASYGVAVLHREGVGLSNMGGQLVVMTMGTYADLLVLAGI